MYCNLRDINFQNIGVWPNIFKMAVIATVCLFLLFLGRVVVIQEQSIELKNSRDHHQKLRTELQSTSLKLADVKDKRNKLQKLHKLNRKLLHHLANQNDLPVLLEKITQVSGKYGVILKDLKSQGEQETNHYRAIHYHLSLMGQYYSIKSFIEKIQGQIPGLVIQDFDLIAERQEENISMPLFKMNLNLLIYCRKKISHQKNKIFEETVPLNTLQAPTETIRSQLLRVHYGKAEEIAAILKEKSNNILSSQGTVFVDSRTNSLWVQDVPDKLRTLDRFVQQIDVPMEQVLIEARIVSINENYEKDLGVKLGLTKLPHLGGTNSENTISNHVDVHNIPLKDRLNFDFGVSPADCSPATLGIALLKLGSGVLLDLELSALESAGDGEIISSPRLITSNQQPARIQAGEEIPYEQATISGATNITFKKAVLGLNVIPHVTPDKKILLKLKINQDKPSVRLVNNVPAIDTREIETEVLVENGQTIVLGGIYEQAKDKQVRKVPFLAELPIIGLAFRRKQEHCHRRELIIFVTPKIIASNA